MFRPTVSTLNANSAGIINTIRDNASAAYQNAIPEVQDTTESIRAVGMQIMAFQPHMNEFVNALVNRIALVMVTSRRYSNPLAWAKKGVFENGETEEEVFVNAAEGMPYNANGEALDMFKLYKGDVRSAFHSLNMQTVYPISINDNELRLAFLSRDGVTDMISRKVESLYSGLSYDEYIMTKYVAARLALDGSIRAWTIPAGVSTDELKQTVTAVKTVTNRFQFYSTDFNVASVNNFTPVDGLYILTTSDFDAQNDVNVLASAFNIDRAEFIGRRAMVDTFAFNENEKARLAKLLAKDPGFQQITEDENEALSSIKAIAMDRDFYRIYDVLPDRFTEQYDAIHLRWNEFLHAWRIYSASPFANAVMFTSTEISITNVTVNGPATVAPGDTATYTANVTGGDFANKGVIFSVDTGSVTAGTVEIDSMGHVTVSEEAEGSFTVKAVSAVNSTKSGTKSVTIS